MHGSATSGTGQDRKVSSTGSKNFYIRHRRGNPSGEVAVNRYESIFCLGADCDFVGHVGVYYGNGPFLACICDYPFMVYGCNRNRTAGLVCE